jgi:hypothetical protein
MGIKVVDHRGVDYHFSRAKSYRIDSYRGHVAISLWTEERGGDGEFLGFFVNPASVIPFD